MTSHAGHDSTSGTGDAVLPVTGNDVVLYTPTAAAKLLAVKESWLRRKAGQRAIPCTFLGKHLRFSTDDLRSITTRGAQSPITQRRPARRPSGRHHPTG